MVRAADFLPQLHRTPTVNEERFTSGLNLVFRGLFKKIVIADLLRATGEWGPYSRIQGRTHQ